jgi:hypothetical protein
MLNKIKKHLIAPHLRIAQIFQLRGYVQYGLHGSIIIVPTNLNIIQIVLLWVPCEDHSIYNFKKKKYLSI